MCWIPLNYVNEDIRNGCKGITYYAGPKRGENRSGAQAGWLMSGKWSLLGSMVYQMIS